MFFCDFVQLPIVCMYALYFIYTMTHSENINDQFLLLESLVFLFNNSKMHYHSSSCLIARNLSERYR